MRDLEGTGATRGRRLCGDRDSNHAEHHAARQNVSEASRHGYILHGRRAVQAMECKLLLRMSVSESLQDCLYAADRRDRRPAAAVHAAGADPTGAQRAAVLWPRSSGRLVGAHARAPGHRRGLHAAPGAVKLRRAGVFASGPGAHGHRRATYRRTQAGRFAPQRPRRRTRRARKSATGCRCSAVDGQASAAAEGRPSRAGPGRRIPRQHIPVVELNRSDVGSESSRDGPLPDLLHAAVRPALQAKASGNGRHGLTEEDDGPGARGHCRINREVHQDSADHQHRRRAGDVGNAVDDRAPAGGAVGPAGRRVQLDPLLRAASCNRRPCRPSPTCSSGRSQ